MIPDQLKRDDLLFVVFEPSGDNKNPDMPRWNAVDNLLRHDDPELQEGIDQDMVIGCAGAPGSGVVILDVDDRKDADPAGIMDICDDTFRLSGYPDERKFKAIFDVMISLKNTETDEAYARFMALMSLCLVAGEPSPERVIHVGRFGGQCVIPPSKSHSGSRYAVTNDVPIKRVKWGDIKHFYPDDGIYTSANVTPPERRISPEMSRSQKGIDTTRF
jgi:hypothetical protein